MTPQNNVVAGVVAVCVLVVASFASYQFGYKNGIGATVSQTQNAPSVPAETLLVYGTVEKISGQDITLNKGFQKISGISASTADQSASMTVVVDQSTIIERLVPKDAETIRKEKTTPSSETFTREKITLNDLTAGDTILAYASGDIATASRFTAVKIELQSVPRPQ